MKLTANRDGRFITFKEYQGEIWPIPSLPFGPIKASGNGTVSMDLESYENLRDMAGAYGRLVHMDTKGRNMIVSAIRSKL